MSAAIPWAPGHKGSAPEVKISGLETRGAPMSWGILDNSFPHFPDSMCTATDALGGVELELPGITKISACFFAIFASVLAGSQPGWQVRWRAATVCRRQIVPAVFGLESESLCSLEYGWYWFGGVECCFGSIETLQQWRHGKMDQFFYHIIPQEWWIVHQKCSILLGKLSCAVIFLILNFCILLPPKRTINRNSKKKKG